MARVSDLETHGVHNAWRHCGPEGPWQRLLPGIVAFTTERPTRDQRRQAALLYAGEGSMLTGRSALDLYGLLRVERSVHVLMPMGRRRHLSDPICEATRRLPTPVIRHGFPLTGPSRAVADAIRLDNACAPHLVPLAIRVLDVSPESIMAELDHGPQRLTADPRRYLRSLS
ncbi:hypothetical protein D5S17_08365 [Pseudonocardiaceae bacterium YIM PH 21723]|nr:hypothetical protein D5S17_08365 [Pseudonocardiaceae bacterium YIM PH 21723]